MKKKLMMLLAMVCLLSGTVYAYPGKTEYKMLEKKVLARKIVTNSDIPSDFCWDECQNQAGTNVFYTAKKVYEKNRKSFAAVYNYALLISFNREPEIGRYASDRQIDESAKMFRKAMALAPGNVRVYERLEELIELKHFGNGVPFVTALLSDRQNFYAKNNDIARTRLGLIEKQFNLRGLTIGGKTKDENLQSKAFEAYIICKTLNRSKDAQKWLITAGGKERLNAEQEYERYQRNLIRQLHGNVTKTVEDVFATFHS